VTIETISDDALLEIFTSYLGLSGIDAWCTLVHVCQRWRYLVFASPRHLNLRIECTIETPAREMLGIWPAFPIVITDDSDSMSGVDNIIAALEQRDRVCEITLNALPGWKMDMFVPAMLGPFPALENIICDTDDATMAVVPDSFLGQSAPQLRRCIFFGIPFPALPTLLSSARTLVDLQLSGIPQSGYISPEVMATCLSAIPGLESFHFEFDFPQSFPNGESRRHHSLARSTLPALRELTFEGLNEYFEDLVARIDTPALRDLEITFFHRHFYEFSQLSRFIGRVEAFKSLNHTNIRLSDSMAEVSANMRTETDGSAWLLFRFLCLELPVHLQLRYCVQVCGSSLLPFSNVENLAISSESQPQQSQWEATAEDFLWLDLLHQFPAVKVLDIDKNSVAPVAYILKEAVKGRMTDIFPTIRELSIGELLPSGVTLRAIEKFATARGLFTRLDRPQRWVVG
jgi:hypothetical protein